jgi:hypothetical protein
MGLGVLVGVTVGVSVKLGVGVKVGRGVARGRVGVSSPAVRLAITSRPARTRSPMAWVKLQLVEITTNKNSATNQGRVNPFIFKTFLLVKADYYKHAETGWQKLRFVLEYPCAGETLVTA